MEKEQGNDTHAGKDPFSMLAQTVSMVEPCTDEALEALLALFRPISVTRDRFFARPGDRPTDLGFVAKGLFRAYYITADGREVNKTFFPEGSFIVALTAITNREKNRVHLQAMEDSAVLVANWTAFEASMAKHHSLERLTRKVLQWAWAQKDRRETQLIMDDATTRYLSFLEEYPNLIQRMPQYQVASYLGISAVQLSRIRAALAKRKPSPYIADTPQR